VLELPLDSGTGKSFSGYSPVRASPELTLTSFGRRDLDFSSTVRALLTLAEVAPPKGGLLRMDKPMTLPSYEYRDKFSGTRRRVLPLSAGGSAIVRGADAGFTGWLRRCALAQYSRLVFSILDGLRAAGSCVGTRSPRNFQGLRNARGITRPLGRHASDRLRGHLRDVADMAVLNNAHE
jgi:hypothetical protein